MKKVLMMASVPSMIGRFNMDNIAILQSLGYEAHVACNFKDRSVWDEERKNSFIGELKKNKIVYHQVEFPRSPINIKNDIFSYKQMEKLISKERFDLIHCHTPVASAIARVVAHKFGIKIIYTAHGFHFYDGAPKKNWIIFYPIEKFLSRWTDVLITINCEDYKRAKDKFHAKKVLYVPGVGVDTEKFNSNLIDAETKRSELGVAHDEIMLFSVGELSERENHEIVIRALKEINNPKIKYFIAGQGNLKKHLCDLIYDLKMELQIELLGNRADVSELCQAADLFVFPSHQEELPVALMEAVACQTPVICSAIRSNKDFVKDNKYLFNEKSLGNLVQCLKKVVGSREDIVKRTKNSVKQNYNILKSFDLESVSNKLTSLYVRELKHLMMQQQFKKENGIGLDGIVLLSVGELNENKNHSIIIKALAELNDEKIHYCIVGPGNLHDELENLALTLGVGNQVHMLGFRNDVAELLHKVDIYVLPSIREGLNVSLMEAMASGLPCIVSDIRGNQDLIRNRKGGYRVKPLDAHGFCKVIKSFVREDNLDMRKYNLDIINKFSKKSVYLRMMNLYSEEI